MEKLKSSLTNMAVVLTVIAVVAGAVLALINAVTAPQIEKINAENLAAGIKTVMGREDISVAQPDTLTSEAGGKKQKVFIVYAISDAAGQAIGQAVLSRENGFNGELQVLIGFDNEGTILGYNIQKTSETPGLGAKAAAWFQPENGEKRSVVGKNPGRCNFTVSKDGGDIDAITASTITSRAFLLAIKNAYDKVYAKADAPTVATPKNNK